MMLIGKDNLRVTDQMMLIGEGILSVTDQMMKIGKDLLDRTHCAMAEIQQKLRNALLTRIER